MSNRITPSFGWVLLSLFLAALDETILTIPPQWGVHAGGWLTFALAVASLISAALAAAAAHYGQTPSGPPVP
jgi:hypothetical protein